MRPARPTPAPVAERSTVEPRVGAVGTGAEKTVRFEEGETVAVRAGTNLLAVDEYSPDDVAAVRRQLVCLF